MGGVGWRQRISRLASVAAFAASFAFGAADAENCLGVEVSPIPDMMIDLYESAVAVAAKGKIEGNTLQHICAEIEDHLRYRIRLSKSVYWVRTSQFVKVTDPSRWQPSPAPTAPAAGTFATAPAAGTYATAAYATAPPVAAAAAGMLAPLLGPGAYAYGNPYGTDSIAAAKMHRESFRRKAIRSRGHISTDNLAAQLNYQELVRILGASGLVAPVSGP